MRNRAPLFLILTAIVSAAPRDRITASIDSSRSHVIARNVHRLAQPQFDRGALDPQTPVNDVLIVFQPSAQQQNDLETLLVQQQNPSSPQFHQWLTPEQFGDRFGLSSADQSKVAAWLRSEGLTVDELARGRGFIRFRGTAGQISRVFRTPLHRFDVGGERHFANTTNPSVPDALAEVVAGFIGLHDFNLQPVGTSTPQATGTTGGHFLAPEDFATIYNLNPLYQAGLDGTGQAIAVAGVSQFLLSDIQAFRKMFNLPANDPKIMGVGTTDPGFTANGQIEADLDLEWVGAVAPKATIYFVYATNGFVAVVFAIDHNLAPILSMSIGSCEISFDSPVYRPFFQQANAQGITALAASGDSGGASCDQHGSTSIPQATHGLAVEFPANLPEVTAVGGTSFNISGGTYFADHNSPNLGSALSYIPEVAWNTTGLTRGLSSSGGGASIIYTKPAWQNGPGVPKDNARDTPDLSLNADNSIGYLTISQGTVHDSGGTSASTPAMAGIVALLNQSQVARGFQKQPGLGNINPHLYQLAQAVPSAFHDITSGDNKVPCVQGSPNCTTGVLGYSAGPGYDLVTGLGSIDANNFITQWNIPVTPVSLTLQSSSTTPSPSDSLSIKATVSAATGSTIPSGTIDLAANGVSLGSAILNAGAASFTFPAFLAGAGNTTIVGEYSGDAAFSSATATLKIQVNAPKGASNVVVTAPPDIRAAGTSNGVPVWTFTVTLTETAGVSTNLTGFSIDDQPQTLSNYFAASAIPGGGTAVPTVLKIISSALNPPSTHTLTLTGADPGTGATWSRQIAIVFLPQSPLGSSMEVTIIEVAQDPTADSSCQWRIPVFVDERGGTAGVITDITLDGASIPGGVVPILGTSRIGAWDFLQGYVCLANANPGDFHTIGFARGPGNTSSATSAMQGPVPDGEKMSVSPSAITLTDSSSATISVTLADQSLNWYVSVVPRNGTGNWLRVAQGSGVGNSQIQVRPLGDGFEPGVYNAVISIFSALDQVMNIPVMFVHGATSPQMSIAAAVNAFSYQPVASPGMLLSIFGSQLANTTRDFSANPQLSVDGVTVSVNGMSAPILYISPSLINIQIPYTAGSGTAALGVNNNGQIAGFQFQITPSAPAMFTDVHGNISGTSILVTGAGDVSPAFPTGFAAPFGTSLSSPQMPILPVSVTVGGINATAQVVGQVATGITQINFTVPPNLAPGVQPVVVTVGGISSQPANLMTGGTEAQASSVGHEF